MKNFEIQCIVYDKNHLSNLDDDQITEIILATVIKSNSVEQAEDLLKEMYTTKEIISIMEIV